MSELAVGPAARPRPTFVSAVLAVVSSVVVASLLCLAVAAVAHRAGASTEFLALTAPVFVTFIVIGAVVGAIGWTIVRRRARDPRRLLRVLVPAVFLLSLVPDVLVGVTGALPGTSWTAVVALMVMHLVVTVCVVAAYSLFLPVRALGSTARGRTSP